jgi:hypothetical protein
MRQGRKAWNATGERDAKTGKWVVDLTMVKPVTPKKKKAKRAREYAEDNGGETTVNKEDAEGGPFQTALGWDDWTCADSDVGL